MAFKPREESRYRGEPITIYLFRYGPSPQDYHAYTDAETNLIVGGIEYKAIPIDRGAVNASGTLDKSALEVQTAQDSELSERFKSYPPSNVVSMVVSQGHEDDGEFLVVWTGRVINYTIEGNTAKFTGEPVSTSMRRVGLRRNYQLGCPHALYGPDCLASQAAAKNTQTVLEIADRWAKLPSGWFGAIPYVKYGGGLFVWVSAGGLTERRTILRFDLGGTRLLLSGDTSTLGPGMAVDVYLGCNHQMTDCGELHNNIQNFGGQPFIPLKNPIGFVSLYY